MGFGMWNHQNQCQKNNHGKPCQPQPVNCNMQPTVVQGCQQEQNSMDIFLEMINSGQENACAAMELFSGAMNETQCAINNLKEGKAFRHCAVGDMQAALSYLEQLMQNNCCNCNISQCQCIQQDMAQAFQEGAAMEDEAFAHLEQAMCILNQAHGRYQCGQGLSKRWLKCLCNQGTRSSEDQPEDEE